MPFRVNAKKFLLTYSRCGAALDDVFNHLDNQFPIKRAIGCIELHEPNPEAVSDEHPTGELPHIHFAIEFVNKLNTTNERWFDYDGFHPSIETARNWEACVNYCRERDNDGNEYPIELKYYRCLEETASVTDSTSDSLVAYIKQCEDFDQWVDWIMGTKKFNWTTARDMWTYYRNNVRDMFTITEPPGIRIFADAPSDSAEAARRILFDSTWGDWVDELDNNGTLKTLVIVGPSGCGKTVWALNNVPLPAMLVRHLDQLRHFDARIHRSVIFDDVKLAHTPIQTQIQVLDRNEAQAIHIRNVCGFLPAGITKVITSAYTVPFVSDTQLQRRSLIWPLDETIDIEYDISRRF